ncbi:Chromo domain containing protein [Aphelenchoides avenae]|nr:Chromo domain containing protein [Aphelenchus avenae]
MSTLQEPVFLNNDKTTPYFIVEEIRKRRWDPEEKAYKYLIKWRHWPESANSWEGSENLKQCQFLKDKFDHVNASRPYAKQVAVSETEPKCFVVEAIRNRRWNAAENRHEYLVKWKSWPEEDNTWETEAYLEKCKKMKDNQEEKPKKALKKANDDAQLPGTLPAKPTKHAIAQPKKGAKKRHSSVRDSSDLLSDDDLPHLPGTSQRKTKQVRH